MPDMSGTARAEELQAELERCGDEREAAKAARFFKTGAGEYGEGDRFRGIRVPQLRKLAKKHRSVALETVEMLLQSSYHEERLLALLVMVEQFRRGNADTREQLFRLYLDNTSAVNNWDLVDSSAPHIVGAHLWERERTVLGELAASPVLWERRIAVMATFHFVKQGELGETLRLVEYLLDRSEAAGRAEHDLVAKACGWMLRESAKRDRETVEAFLRRNHARMPRVMLRYAIERFPEELRKGYLRGEV